MGGAGGSCGRPFSFLVGATSWNRVPAEIGHRSNFYNTHILRKECNVAKSGLDPGGSGGGPVGGAVGIQSTFSGSHILKQGHPPNRPPA